jgi:hypothetical protein
VGVKWGKLSTFEELLGRKISGPGLENREYGRMESVTLTKWHPLSAKVGTNFAERTNGNRVFFFYVCHSCNEHNSEVRGTRDKDSVWVR